MIGVITAGGGPTGLMPAGDLRLPAGLLVVCGRHILHRILVTAFGVDAAVDHDESGRLVGQVNSDPMAWIVFTLTDAPHNQAALAGDDPAAPKLIARYVLLVIHAFSDADDQDALALLRALRDAVFLRADWTAPGARAFPAGTDSLLAGAGPGPAAREALHRALRLLDDKTASSSPR